MDVDRKLKTARAWACFWIMRGIEEIASPFPRSPAKARAINAITAPFAPYAFYWALISNPNLTPEQRDRITMRKRKNG